MRLHPPPRVCFSLMRRFFDTKTTLIASVTVFALILGVVVYVRAEYVDVGSDTTSDAATSLAVPAPSEGPVELPDELIIPKLTVDAHVQRVGLAKSGNMAVPTNYTDVGWYKLGTAPGQVGSAVIDGHVDNGFGKDAVFKHLSELAPGDDLYIQTDSGARLHFIVEDVEAYPVANVPLQKIFNSNDKARLTLITCSGAFDTKQLEYDQRRVVYAVLGT